MKKEIRLLLTSGILLLLTGILFLLARFAPDFFFSFYTDFSKSFMGALGDLTELLPFSLFEWGFAALIAAALVFLVIAVRKRRFGLWASGVILGVTILFSFFTAGWGLNHFGPSVSEALGLETRLYSRDELREAAIYYRDMAGITSAEVPQNEAGISVFSSFEVLADDAKDGFAQLAEKYALFDGSHARVKKLLSGKLFSYMGTTGIFSAFTGEANVNPYTYPAALPHTMCHEMSHRLGVAHENDANFCAFLACCANKNPEYQYSGYYIAFINCFNSLYEVDPQGAQALWDGAGERLLRDVHQTSVYYDQYEGKVQDAAQSVNDSYLKVFGEELGVQSYGAVTDHLIAWYLKNR